MTRLFRTDFHVHTHLSDCGSPDATPKAMLAAARAAGLEAVGFSDHVILREHRQRAAILRRQLPKRVDQMRVYLGCEADVLNPTDLAIDEEFARSLDYVLVSASHLFEPNTFHPVEGLDAPTMAAYLLHTMRVAIDSGLADVVVHPFHVPSGMFTFAQLVAEANPDAISRLGEHAARAGVAIEFSPRELKLYPEAAHWLYGRLLATPVKLSINSDSHHPNGLGFRSHRHASEAEMLAEGITEDRLWRIEDRVSAGRRGLPV